MFTNQHKRIKQGGARGWLIVRNIILIIFLMALNFSTSINNVFAQEGTETPEPSSTPEPYSTPIPTSEIPDLGVGNDVILGDCPEYDPDNTRELSLKWLAKCGQCVNNGNWNVPTFEYSNLPTYDFNFGSTPTFDPATTPTTTDTPEPTLPLLGYFLWQEEEAVNLIPEYPHLFSWTDLPRTQYTTNWYSLNQEHYSTQETTFYFEYDGTFGFTPNSTYGVLNTGFMLIGMCKSKTCKITLPDNTVITQGLNDEYIFWEDTVNIGTGGLLQTGVINAKVQFTPRDDYYKSYLVRLDKKSDFMTTTSGSQMFTWNYDPIPFPTEGYCSNYVYADEEEQEQLIIVPDLNIWQGECISFIPPFEWGKETNLPFNISFSFPGFGVCPVWVEITPMEIAQIKIPMEILYLPALMFVMGLLFKL